METPPPPAHSPSLCHAHVAGEFLLEDGGRASGLRMNIGLTEAAAARPPVPLGNIGSEVSGSLGGGKWKENDGTLKFA